MTGASSKRFPAAELKCPCCGVNGIKQTLIDSLEKLHKKYGKPMPVVSGFMCSTQSRLATTDGPLGPQTTGLAAVIHVDNSVDAFRLVRLAIELGFTGIGLKQHGENAGRRVHLDIILGVHGIPRPAMFTHP